MAGRRLVPANHVERWEKELRAATSTAWDVQHRSVVRKLRTYGVTGSLTAAGKRKKHAHALVVGPVWNDAVWASLVDLHVKPVADRVAKEATAAAQAAVPAALTAGMAVSAAATSSAIVGSAITAGRYLGGRLNGNVSSAEDPALAAEDVFETGDAILGNTVGGMATSAAETAAWDVTSFVAGYFGNKYSGATRTWNAVDDAATREWHAEADGQMVALNATFEVGGESLTGPGDPSGSDENVINCRCVPAWSKVSGVTTAAARRPFQGHLTHVTTAFGHQFSATSDHPILTQRGWIRAGSLLEGDQVLRDRRMEWMAGSDPDISDGPPEIHQVFGTLAEIAAYRGERADLSAMDLDGAPPDSKIEVVLLNDNLAVYHDAPRFQQPSEFVLASSHAQMGGPGPHAPIGGILHSETVGQTASPDLNPSFDQSIANGPTVDAESIRQCFFGFPGQIAADDLVLVDVGFEKRRHPAGSGGFADVSSWDAETLELVADGVGVKPECWGDLIGRFPSVVAPDEIVEVDIRPYVGHVYDLTTVTGWFMVDGILIHNCWTTTDGLDPAGSDQEGEGA